MQQPLPSQAERDFFILPTAIAAMGAKERAGDHGFLLRGINSLSWAQFLNENWPQVWPLEGG